MADNLQAALETRAVIDQAKGILMERHKLTADQAFQLLARISMTTNRKLRASPTTSCTPASCACHRRGGYGGPCEGPHGRTADWTSRPVASNMDGTGRHGGPGENARCRL